MPNCPACSGEYPTDTSYCPHCGRPVATALPATVAPVTADALQEGFVPGVVLAGRYRIVMLLGRGGMGEVYRADDLVLGQAVAIKFLPAHLATDPDLLARFRQEVALARQVSHAHVCRVYDIGEIEGRPFLTMEYIDGENLASLLKRVGRLAEEKALEMARQLCAALEAVHEVGLLHRDLKPGNVMLDGRGRVKLTDFGLATVAGAVRDVRAGTPLYMAPEQLAGQQVTVQSDLFALGLVLYEVFTGKRAFTAGSLPELARQYEQPPSNPSSHVSGVSPAVERTILRCLERLPEHRPGSAAEVLAALSGLPTADEVANSPVQGSIPVWVGTILLAAILVGLLLFAWLTDLAGLHRRLPLREPAYLRNKARDLLVQLGYPALPVDSAEGVLVDAETRRRELERLPAAEAWRGLATGRPAVLFYWYRHSPGRIVHRQSPNDILGYGIAGLVTIGEPPLAPGEVCVALDINGHLIELHARPGGPLEAEPHADWAPLFQAAGLDRTQLRETAPGRDPGCFAPERLAWEGDDPFRPGCLLRVEAAARAGQPVYFWVGTSGGPDRTTVEDVPLELAGRVTEYAYTGIRVLALTVGAVLAWRNVRRGVANPVGAMRLALICAGSFLIMWVFLAHHVASPGDEWAMLTAAVGGAGLNALTLWVIYLALEPSVRRLQPGWVIGWNRLLAGRWRDPLVGREILVGCLIGVYWASLFPLQHTLLPEALGLPFTPYTVWLPTLTVNPVGSIASYIWTALFLRLLDFFVLTLVYLLCRRLSVAVAVWGLFWAFQWSLWLFPAGPVLSIGMALMLVTLAALALLRSGLLTFVIFALVGETLTDLPVTLDWQAWYATTSFWVLACVIALAGYAFASATAGGPLFPEDAPEPARAPSDGNRAARPIS
jgi:serine/threonine-protein kinase